MLEQAMTRVHRWALDRADTQWVDYVVSNTMTDLNRRLNGFLWTYDLKAQVVRVLEEAAGVKTYVLRPNQHWRGFRPGQHVEVIVPGPEGGPWRRYYSISGRPGQCISITVKQADGGQVSRWMHAHLKPGMVLRIGHPQGRFCYQGQAKVLFLTAGSGITPCHSMVSALLADDTADRPDLQIIAQFRRADDVIFKNELRQWASQGVNVTTALSGEAPLQGHAPKVDLALLQAQCPDLLERDIYLCGPSGFMNQMMEHFRTLNVDLGRVHTERFALPAAPQAQSCVDEFDAEGAEVVFQHLGARITLTAQDKGKTLLQLAQARGVSLESGCQQGMCGTCKLTVHAGEVSGNVLGQAAYLCTSYPASRTVVLGA